MPRVRLDTYLAEHGMAESRSRAAALILAGDVLLGPDRARAEKPGQLVAEGTQVALRDRPRYVSRGGDKLAGALDVLGVPVAGRDALDVGASTGGFTDCLLQRGAARVICVDVAYGTLDWRLREDPRVTVLERTNARALTPDALPFRADLVVLDLSFISLTKVLPAVLPCLAPGWDVLAMVKPQFEVGRDRVGKGGVVRDPELRHAAIAGVAECARGLGATVRGVARAGLDGPKGNRESFVWLASGGEGIDDVLAAAAEADA